jgi:outer membrane protein assembly factor BamB
MRGQSASRAGASAALGPGAGGSAAWAASTGGAAIGGGAAPVVGAGEIIYLGADDGVFRAFNATGSLIWS